MQTNQYNQRPSRRPRRGAAVLEAALVLPLLLALIFGGIEFGYAFFVKHTLQGASREGARRAAVADSNTEVTKAVDDALQGAGLGDISKSVRITNIYGNNVNVAGVGEGTSVVVRVEADWSQFSFFISSFSGVNLGKLKGNTVMRRER